MAEQALNEIIADFDIDDPTEIRTVKAFVKANDLDGLILAKVLKEKTTRQFWNRVQASEKIRPSTPPPTKNSLYLRYPATKGKEGDGSKLRAVVMGSCGNGKTSLMNNICRTNYRTGESLHSETRNITAAYVLGYDFILLDTPGTTAEQEVNKHAQLLRASLTYRPINVAFINCTYEKRGTDLIRNMEYQTRLIERYSDHVVYLVSHVDTSDDPTKLIPAIYEEMDKRDMKQQVVFYSNKYCDYAKLANTLYLIATNYSQIQIEITQEEFKERFKIGSMTKLLRKQFQNTFKQMGCLTDAYIDCAKTLPNDQEKENVIQELALDLKYSLQQILQEFAKEAEDLMYSLDYYEVYYDMQKIILDSDERFQNAIRPQIQLKLLHQSKANEKEGILDLIKQCPACKEIWWRVEACPNTTCGARPSSFWDYNVGRSFFIYRIEKVGSRIRVVRKEKLSEASKNQIRIDQKLDGLVKESKSYKGEWEFRQEQRQCRQKLSKLWAAETKLTTQLQESLLKPIVKNEVGFAERQEDWSQLLLCINALFNKLQRLNDQKWSERKFTQCAAFEEEWNDLMYERELRITKQTVKNDLERLKKTIKDSPAKPDQHWKTLVQIVDKIKAVIGKKRFNIGAGTIASNLDEVRKNAAEASKQPPKDIQDSDREAIWSAACRLESIVNEIESARFKTKTDAELAASLSALVEKAVQIKINLRLELLKNSQLTGNEAHSLHTTARKLEKRSLGEEILDAKIYNLQQTTLPACRSQLDRVERDIREKKKLVGCGHPMNFEKLPRIPNIEKILKEMYNVSDIKQLQERLNPEKMMRIDQERLNQLVSENLKQCEQNVPEVEKQKPPHT